MYQITSDDGKGNQVRVKLPRNELCKMIGDAILLGVIASQKIEGEASVRLALVEPVDLPEGLLETKGTVN